MIKDFGNKQAFDLFHRGQSRKVPRKHWKRAIHLFDIMDVIESLEELKTLGFPPSVRLHALKGSRNGEFAIDVHKLDGWRITFRLDGSNFCDVKIEDYH